MANERVEVSRTIPASRAEIFSILRDPSGHVAIDASGMLMGASGDPVSEVGDTFQVQMDREALNDVPLGRYEVTVRITTYDSDREIAWVVEHPMVSPPMGYVYGFTLAPVETGTLVTSYCDWSNVHETWRPRISFPVVPESSLRATLGILERTVLARSSRSRDA